MRISGWSSDVCSSDLEATFRDLDDDMWKALLDALDVTVHIEQFALKEGERSVTATVSGTKHSLAHAASVPGGLLNNPVRISDREWRRGRDSNPRGGFRSEERRVGKRLVSTV